MRITKYFFNTCCILIVLMVCVPQWTRAQSIKDTDVYRRLQHAIDRIWIVDTHEHLGSEEDYLKKPVDFLARMLHYVESDLVSAGMERPRGLDWGVKFDIQDTSKPLSERWPVFMKFWNEMRFTGYGKAMQTVVNDLYGLDINTLTPASAKELNKRIEAANTPGLYRRILKDKARIELSMVDIEKTDVDREFFVPVMCFDYFMEAQSKVQLEAISGNTGVPIRSLQDMVTALEKAFDDAVNEGIVGIKSRLAYDRRIYYPRPTEAEAEAAFNKILGTYIGYARTKKVPSWEEIELYQNYIMHQICRLAAEYKITFQIHTGIQTGAGNIVTNAKPTDLLNLIMEYPDVKFDLFHGGYPYGRELGAMAKNFQNVYIDMVWTTIISPKLSREFLSEWIEIVPANKIIAFGGDYSYVEGAYAHAKMVREMVTETLAEKVISGYLTEEEANELAIKFLRTNPIELFNLPLQK